MVVGIKRMIKWRLFSPSSHCDRSCFWRDFMDIRKPYANGFITISNILSAVLSDGRRGRAWHSAFTTPPTRLYSTLVSSDDQSKWVFGWVRIYGRHQMGFYDTYNINSSSGQPPPLTSSLCPLPASSSSRIRMRMRIRIRILYPLLLYLQSEGHLYRAIGHSIRTILISRPLHHLQWALYDF